MVQYPGLLHNVFHFELPALESLSYILPYEDTRGI